MYDVFLQAVFAEVYELDIDEDVNKVLFALPQPLQSPGSTAQGNSSKRGSSKHSKKSKGSVGSQDTKPVVIDGSAAGVRMLKNRLQGLMEASTSPHLSDLESMLQNLSLCK